jgi:hypothetical protein
LLIIVNHSPVESEIAIVDDAYHSAGVGDRPVEGDDYKIC